MNSQPLSAWTWLGVKISSLPGHLIAYPSARGPCPCRFRCKALTSQGEIHPGHTSQLIRYQCRVGKDSKGKGKWGFQLPKLTGGKGVRMCSLTLFFSLPKPLEQILLILMFILAKAMRQPSPHCYFWLLFTVPSLGSRFSQAETYLLPCLLTVTCPHFIQELKDSILPGQLSPCLSP